MAQQSYKVIVSSKAARMLVEHAAFIANVSTDAAERFVDKFEAAAGSLKLMPHRCPWLTGDYIPRNKYRKLLFEQRYLIVYQVADDNVYIDYVIDTRQSYDWLI